MNIEKYFQHIGISKPTTTSIDVLNKIHKHHLLSIPFENLDIINGKALSMDPSLILKKVTENKRGGICFETNSLLFTVLLDLGFDVHFISAKFWNEEKQAWNPEFSHLALLVKIDQQNYLADVGIGGGFLLPLLLEHNYEYSDSNGTYRVIEKNESTFILQKHEKSSWNDLLCISLETKELHQFTEQLKYYQTSTETIFTKNKIVNLLTTDGRITLSDHQLKITKNNEINVKEFETAEEWQKIYEELFQPTY